MEILGYIATILMGFSLGAVGGGGSILTVPILVYFFKQDPQVATTGSLIVVGATSFVGALNYSRRGLVDFQTSILFAIPGLIGVSFVRGLLLPAIPEYIFSIGTYDLTKSGLILSSFAFLMMMASFSMIRPRKPAAESLNESITKKYGAVGIKGFLIGSVTGFVGAGGGFLIVPALVILLGLPMRRAVGTSLAIITFNSLFGFLVGASQTSLDWPQMSWVVVLGVVGLLLGYKITPQINEQRLKKGFGYLVLIVGVLISITQISAL